VNSAMAIRRDGKFHRTSSVVVKNRAANARRRINRDDRKCAATVGQETNGVPDHRASFAPRAVAKMHRNPTKAAAANRVRNSVGKLPARRAIRILRRQCNGSRMNRSSTISRADSMDPIQIIVHRPHRIFVTTVHSHSGTSSRTEVHATPVARKAGGISDRRTDRTSNRRCSIRPADSK